jgi:Ca-activated chloride channel homolog
MKHPIHWAYYRLNGFFFICSILSFISEASAQSSRTFDFLNGTLKVDVDYITLSLSAKDKNRRYVDNLKKEDLELFEDEVSQQITHFDLEPMPLSLVVLLDVSESTGPFFREIETTARILSDLLEPQDEATVIAFSDLPSTLQEFTSNKGKLLNALERDRREFSGATNINDSVYLAAKKLSSVNSNKRRLILLISDGKGNRGEAERAVGELKTSEATVLGVGLGLTSKLYRGAVTLSRLAKETGGNLLFYSRDSDFKKSLRAALQQVRSQYSIGYVSSNKKRDGRFRRLKVEISRNSPLVSNGVIIQIPSGYFAPSDSALHY